MRLSGEQKRVLHALAKGRILKAHRHLDGTKIFLLHALDGPPEAVRGEVIAALEKRRLIDSNKKFPVATFLLTDTGRAVIAALAGQEH